MDALDALDAVGESNVRLVPSVSGKSGPVSGMAPRRALSGMSGRWPVT